MTILLNGQSTDVPAGCSISQLIAELRFSGRLAVELNGEIVPRSAHEHTLLHEGDRMEIVQAIGGG